MNAKHIADSRFTLLFLHLVLRVRPIDDALWLFIWVWISKAIREHIEWSATRAYSMPKVVGNITEW